MYVSISPNFKSVFQNASRETKIERWCETHILVGVKSTERTIESYTVSISHRLGGVDWERMIQYSQQTEDNCSEEVDE